MNNRAFKALLKSKGYNRGKLAEELKLSGNSVGRKYTGKIPWTWPEVCKVCAALGITLDEFATYYPVADVIKTAKPEIRTKNECICEALDSLKKALTI